MALKDFAHPPADLQLDLSRETAQGGQAVYHVRSTVAKRVLGVCTEVAEDEPAKYRQFSKQFGGVLQQVVRRMRGSGLPNQPVLDISPRHPLIERLNRRQDDPWVPGWAHVLSLLTTGARVEEPSTFVTRLNELLLSLTADEIV